MFAVYAHVAGRRGLPKDPIAEDAVRVLRGAAPELLQDVIADVTEGREPDLDQVKRLNRRLWKLARGLREQLDRRVQRAWQAVEAVAKALRRDTDGTMLLVATDSCMPPPDIDQRTLPEQDRYLNMLACLIERARDVLELRPGNHRLALQVAGRRVYDKALGRAITLDLRTVTALRPPQSATVRSLAWAVIDYARLTGEAPEDEPLVLADFSSNHFFSVIQQRAVRGMSIDQLEAHVEPFGVVNSAVPTAHEELTRGRVSHIAGTGQAAAMIHAGVPVTYTGAPLSLWAWEQAQQWIRVKGVSA
jgi:hypothetical protein